MLAPAALGFATGLSLIVAIGAQNAFVLRQGLRREHVGAVIAVCALSDAVLIVAGVAGLGVLVEQHPGALRALTWFGAAFLIGYGLLAARRALSPSGGLDPASYGAGASLASAVTTCLALTWLNPHVYLDTVVLLGSLGNAQGDPGRWWFAVGGVVASLAWFSALGLGARLLDGFMSRPSSWRVLDGFVAVVMFVLAVLLLLRG